MNILMLLLLSGFFIQLPTEVSTNEIEETSVYYKDVKAADMRITGYYNPEGNLTALGEKPVSGKTAAVSPECAKHFLGEKVYVSGHGVFYVNDLTHPRLDTKYDMCTLDLYKGTKKEALAVGNESSTVIKIKE